ncbi:MAG: ABC transporter ATP-binding protein, partial [Cyanobacteriota bacterium]|nr:ABC transporter ATP-binding protein [Cyanobacteriota bacterium]
QSDWYYAMQKGGVVASGATSDLSAEMLQRFLSV